MTFFSYAQNFEDLMLFRALGHIEQGFYVDVGAQHAVRDSVTAAFYERGWRGINIEPVPKWARLLKRLRPRDINVQAAISPDADEVEIHEAPGGLSTTVDAYADRYREEGRRVRSLRVPAVRLDRVLEEFAPRDIHFLKIDVEGAERAVLECAALDTRRPWIVVVEATRPNSQEVVSSSWEDLVLSADYQRVYFDGLNVFFIARERMDLAAAFHAPPNVFDQVQIAESARTINRLTRQGGIARHRAAAICGQLKQQQAVMEQAVAGQAARAGAAEEWAIEQRQRAEDLGRRNEEYSLQVERTRSRHAQVMEQLLHARAQAHRAGGLSEELARLRGSVSWRVTAPMRMAMRIIRGHASPVEEARASLRWLIRSVWTCLRRNVVVAQRVERLVANSPSLHRRLQRIATGRVSEKSPEHLVPMSTQAQAVFNELAGYTPAEHT